MRNTIGRISQFILIGALIISSSQVLATSEKQPNAFRVSVDQIELAQKIAISFHHALLEVDYKSGFIIADLSAAEVADLRALGLEVSLDITWQKKYQTFQKNALQLRKNKGQKQTGGIPGYPCYASVEETLQLGADLAATYPKLAQWIDIGDSWKKTDGQGGYDLMVLKITNKDITGTKPILFLNSGMHAREYTPVALTTDFAQFLLAEYNSNADAKWIVDHHEVHILLQTNPDGRKVAETGVYQRKNVHQNSCPTNEQGVDLNRNFAHFWNSTANGSSGNACSEVYRGASAESEPETIAISNYMRAIFPDARGPNQEDAAPDDTTGMHIDIHSYSELVLWPYGHTDTVSGNDASFRALGNKLAWFNNYSPQQSIGLYPTDGTSDDVSYGELGVAALTFELGTDFFQQCDDYTNTIKQKNLDALLYSAKVIAAPYKLPFGPEITTILINDAMTSTGLTVVAPGSIIKLAVIADISRTKQSSTGQSISKIEYSIDTPLWLTNANVNTLNEHDGSLSSVSETFNGQVSTNGLADGQHTLYLRAFSHDNKQGVVSAIFFKVGVNSRPIADFTYQCSHLVCDFNANLSSDSDGSIASYQWMFTGDQVSTVAEGSTVSHSFTSAGDKTATLYVTDNSNTTAEKVMSFSITAPENNPPVANFTYTCTDLVCNFDASSSSDPDGSISSYQWDFSDGVTLFGSTLNHSFASAGEKTAKLTVTDNATSTTEKSISFSIDAPKAPTPAKSSGGSWAWLNLLLALMLLRRKS